MAFFCRRTAAFFLMATFRPRGDPASTLRPQSSPTSGWPAWPFARHIGCAFRLPKRPRDGLDRLHQIERLAAGADLVPEVASDEVRWTGDRADPWYVAFTPGLRADQVVVAGEIVVDRGRCTRVDGERIRARAWEEAKRLWERL